ncbi:hypothetical protein SAMN05216403_10112 [Nitrosospira multiformis ATCC 25196]|uniref:Uncharacterized protein n=1 Tax=Nitrosospira multiformis (strain ATCC 25196 / NCIMB 11849 / C 71) TaxID=323848 RepID=A0A1H5RKI9_NITMU|nr:hypothetical protein SAMN05216403_10112 [Nitrosospira multiformis ATCC 25196]
MILNFTKNNPESYLSFLVVKSVLFWLVAILASMTILTHIAQVSGITFKIYARLGLFLTLGMSLLAWNFFRRQYGQRVLQDLGTLSFLILTGLGGAFISSFFHTGAGKVSFDLFYYVPNAVYYLQNPDLPMGFAIHFMEAGSEPITSYFGATSLPYEYTLGVLAYFLNIPYLSAFFLVSPALLGFLIPLTLFYLVAQFVDPKPAAVGALFAVAIILLLGETPRTPGTWSFPNVFIGKVFFLSTGIPLFAAATINFFRTYSLSDWMLTFAVTTAMVGATSSSMALLPVLTIAVVIACAAANEGSYKQFLKNAITYAFSLSYLVLYTLLMFLNFHSDLSANSPVNEDFPVTFLGHAGFFFEKSGPATPLALLGATVLGLLMTSGKTRRFLLAWIGAALVLFLNPIVSPFIIKYLTTPNIYWRVFYVYPLPLLLGLTGAGLYEYVEKYSRTVRLAFISGTVFLLFIAHFVPFTTSVLYLRTEFGWPRYKLPARFEKAASDVIAVVPPGPMLAPLPVNGIITMLSGNYPQMRVFTDAERVWFRERGLGTEIDQRICASEFVNGDEPDCLPAFQTLLEYENLRSVVIAKNTAADPRVQNALTRNGFANSKEIGDLLVYWR